VDHSEIDHETQRIRQEAAKLLMEGSCSRKQRNYVFSTKWRQ